MLPTNPEHSEESERLTIQWFDVLIQWLCDKFRLIYILVDY